MLDDAMSALVEKTAAPGRTGAEAWSALGQPATAAAVCEAWLGLLCRELARADAGLVLLEQADGAFAPAAALPADRDLRHLAEVASRSLRSRLAETEHDDLGHARLALPLLASGPPAEGLAVAPRLLGAVVLQLGRVDAAEVARVRSLAQWGAGWLVDLLRQRALEQSQARLQRAAFLLDTLLAGLAERSPREAALALVNRVGRAFDSPQVHLARTDGASLRLLALSHAAWFDERTSLLHAAQQAMQEAVDQQRRIAWPSAGAGIDGPVDAAHRRYAELAGAAALLTLPLMDGGAPRGVLMVERDRPFEPDEAAALEALALAVAPVLALQEDARLGAAARLWRTTREAVAFLAGPRWPAAKLLGGLALVALVLLATVPVPFRIAAPAVVEGAVQRAAVAPFEGFLREAPARAGDRVAQGQLLARLDDRDLQLERVRWEAELEVATRKEREAMAAGKAVDQRLAAAQASQARAQLDLALSRLERARIVAPFDGLVVKGDLSQQLGSPVEQGKVLFELAPLTAWRVILKVDERDIGHVATGARGELVLASLPGQGWPLTVRQLTPVSVAEDGRNFFRVEADLAEAPAAGLRPNMEGVAKVDSGRASLLWAWTRPLADWLRLAWWRVVP